ncbi:MAG TPA: nitroreductase family protein [Candidatus Acidoferrales bacterium]|nr:nitroreductase family protein [Candidatus Acidoferrales bacterium]
MEKAAPAEYPIEVLLSRRWSPRAFENRPVEATKLGHLFEAARWAASSYNEQPWNYIVATREHPAEFQKMLNCLVEFNQSWAKAAPVLAISVARTTFRENGSPNRHAQHDTGAASTTLALEAVALGLAVHQMAGFVPDQARMTYHIPQEFEPMAAMAIGYPGDPGGLPDKLRERENAPRVRRPISEFVFSGDWGHSAAFTRKGDN